MLDSISHDRTTPNVAKGYQGAAEPSVLPAASPAPSEEADAALEARLPIPDHPSEGLRVHLKSSLKTPAPGRSGPIARFALKTLKTAATLLILVLADSYRQLYPEAG